MEKLDSVCSGLSDARLLVGLWAEAVTVDVLHRWVPLGSG